MAGTVVRISIAPVKSLHLVHPDEVELTRAGVVGDRRFWLLDGDGRLANGKRFPQLMQIRPEWDEATRQLAFDLPGGERVDGVVEPGEPVETTLYGMPHPSRRVGGPWEEAISELAGEPMTLLWSDGGAVDRGSDRGGWASIISRASLERLGAEAGTARRPTGASSACSSRSTASARTRRTSGSASSFASGEAVVAPLGDVGRCVVTTKNPDTGELAFPTLDTLAGYRREGVTEPLPLGVYCDVVEPGRVRARRSGRRRIAFPLWLERSATRRRARSSVCTSGSRRATRAGSSRRSPIAWPSGALRWVSPSAISPNGAGRRSRRSRASSAAAGRRGSTRCCASPTRSNCDLVVELAPRDE